MKPSWDDAPEWANYMAMDFDGEWYWFEFKPQPAFEMWIHGVNTGRCQLIEGHAGNWKETLERRP